MKWKSEKVSDFSYSFAMKGTLILKRHCLSKSSAKNHTDDRSEAGSITEKNMIILKHWAFFEFDFQLRVARDPFFPRVPIKDWLPWFPSALPLATFIENERKILSKESLSLELHKTHPRMNIVPAVFQSFLLALYKPTYQLSLVSTESNLQRPDVLITSLIFFLPV